MHHGVHLQYHTRNGGYTGRNRRQKTKKRDLPPWSDIPACKVSLGRGLHSVKLRGDENVSMIVFCCNIFVCDQLKDDGCYCSWILLHRLDRLCFIFFVTDALTAHSAKRIQADEPRMQFWRLLHYRTNKGGNC